MSVENLKFVLIILFAILLIVFSPILVIWSLNTLFPLLSIPYTLETWIAAFVLSGAFGSFVKSASSTLK